jgi:ribosomal protein L11 methyltransferase
VNEAHATVYYTRLTVICPPDHSEILMAEIAEAGFDTFLETDHGFEAYGEQPSRESATAIQEKYRHIQPLLFRFDQVEKQNWNEEWEKNVEPVIVADAVLVRAAFHQLAKPYPYEIIITPKMSFGTGHHPTTHLMLQAQLSVDHAGKYVMDAGCGTGILAVMASKRGATRVDAFDIDEWSVENARENVAVNHCHNVEVWLGKLGMRTYEHRFAVILANINKNILLADMPALASHLEPQGMLLLSGFYSTDLDDMIAAGRAHGLRKVTHYEREGWASLVMKNE